MLKAVLEEVINNKNNNSPRSSFKAANKRGHHARHFR